MPFFFLENHSGIRFIYSSVSFLKASNAPSADKCKSLSHPKKKKKTRSIETGSGLYGERPIISMCSMYSNT